MTAAAKRRDQRVDEPSDAEVVRVRGVVGGVHRLSGGGADRDDERVARTDVRAEPVTSTAAHSSPVSRGRSGCAKSRGTSGTNISAASHVTSSTSRGATPGPAVGPFPGITPGSQKLHSGHGGGPGRRI